MWSKKMWCSFRTKITPPYYTSSFLCSCTCLWICSYILYDQVHFWFCFMLMIILHYKFACTCSCYRMFMYSYMVMDMFVYKEHIHVAIVHVHVQVNVSFHLHVLYMFVYSTVYVCTSSRNVFLLVHLSNHIYSIHITNYVTFCIGKTIEGWSLRCKKAQRLSLHSENKQAWIISVLRKQW